MQAVLEYLKQDYGNPPIYIYENALSLSLSLSLSLTHTHTHTHTYTYTPFFFPLRFLWRWNPRGNPLGQQENFTR